MPHPRPVTRAMPRNANKQAANLPSQSAPILSHSPRLSRDRLPFSSTSKTSFDADANRHHGLNHHDHLAAVVWDSVHPLLPH